MPTGYLYNDLDFNKLSSLTTIKFIGSNGQLQRSFFERSNLFSFKKIVVSYNYLTETELSVLVFIHQTEPTREPLRSTL